MVVEIFKKMIIDAFEPFEVFRTGKLADEFIYDFARKSGQGIAEYNAEWEVEYQRVVESLP